ncbi:MAG: hypothetical protein GY773_21065 [Actinomycetia bacterium]|nr:hypothetical protein [Actinomycetes bacterium]
MTHPLNLAQEAAGTLTSELGSAEVAVVLGSGWAAAAEGLGTVTAELPLGSVPGVAPPTVEGHSGMIRAVTVGDKTAWLFGGRTHLYEGHGPHDVVHTVRAAVLAGCSTVILTNAAGSLDPAQGLGFSAGSLCLAVGAQMHRVDLATLATTKVPRLGIRMVAGREGRWASFGTTGVRVERHGAPRLDIPAPTGW